MSSAISYFGIAKKAGALEIGEENSGSAVRSGKAKLLVVAADSSDNARSRAENFIYCRKTQLAMIPYSKEQISNATGTAGCSMAAFTDIGLASAFLSSLATEYPKYREAAELLNKRNDKSLMRKREAKAHEINVKKGRAASAARPGKRRNEK